ncbi:apolipoprotein L3-like [Mixophyes fleayi]|uniref:apolipoprotein L3-like n=1 Tax=Mixophyes fleayi TaxID=3061075 RepID=UPI003F4DDF81
MEAKSEELLQSECKSEELIQSECKSEELLQSECKPEELLQSECKPEELLQSIMTSIEEFTVTWTSLMDIIEKCIAELLGIADEIDTFHKGATIASVTGSTFGIAGGVATIAGLALAPFTLGLSMVVSGVGIGVAVAGGVTGAAASIADTVNIKNKCQRADEIVAEFNRNLTIIQDMSNKIESKLEDLRSVLANEQIIQQAGRIGGRGAFVAVELSRLIHLGKVSAAATQGAQLLAHGARVARAVSGVFAAVFIVVDAAFVVKGATDLQEGAKTEAAAEIRKIAHELQETFESLKEQDKTLYMEYASFLKAK